MTRASRENPVVITGAGMVTALGHTVEETWENLIAGKTGIRAIESFDARGFACRVAAQIRELDSQSFSFPAKWTRIADLHTAMLLKCSQDAYRLGGLEALPVPRDAIGFFAGMGVVDDKLDDLVPAVLASRRESRAMDMGLFFATGWQEIYPLFTLSMLNNISFCLAAIELDIRGENAVFAPHADAGAQALIEAVNTLLEEKSTVALSGGVSEKISAMSLARGHITDELNMTAGTEVRACRPFASDRAGTVLGEACAILCLELRASADARRAGYSTAITGYGQAFGVGEFSSGPTVAAIGNAMRRALAIAGLAPNDIDVLIAHGDGSKNGDQNELTAIENVFCPSLKKLLVYSSKAALGHSLAAAAVVDALLGVAMLEKHLIPPTLPLQGDIDDLPFRLVNGAPLAAPCRRVMINCRSGQGQAASLVLEKIV
jgi:3-oxoacyl-[acyl-carrier-protein] synthase II